MCALLRLSLSKSRLNFAHAHARLHTHTSALVFSHVITVNQLFVHGSSHKTREKEHRYASGAPH